MARPAKTSTAINRGLFSDIYTECCKTDAEKMILDIIIAEFFSKEVFTSGPASERAVAKLTGLSKSGVRVVEGRAMAKVKKYLQKQGIRSSGDVLSYDGGRSAVGGGSVDN